MCPCSCSFKINCDGAFNPLCSLGAAAFMIGDYSSKLIDGDAFTFPYVRPEFVEFQAVKAAVVYARSCAAR